MLPLAIQDMEIVPTPLGQKQLSDLRKPGNGKSWIGCRNYKDLIQDLHSGPNCNLGHGNWLKILEKYAILHLSAYG